MATADVLTLSTTDFDRPVVAIDGTKYQMRHPDELSVQMQRRINAIVRAAEGETPEDPDLKIEASDERLGDQVREVMVDVPDDVITALSPIQKARILKVFTKLVNDALGATEASDSTAPSSPSPAPGASSAAN